jgi:hypothetical protein
MIDGGDGPDQHSLCSATLKNIARKILWVEIATTLTAAREVCILDSHARAMLWPEDSWKNILRGVAFGFPGPGCYSAFGCGECPFHHAGHRFHQSGRGANGRYAGAD